MKSITVCICTHNRADLLALCLNSLAEQNGFQDARVIVVANNCTDHTPYVVAEYAERIPHLLLVEETQAGLSHARNRGLSECSTELIAYLDDDVIVAPGWIDAICAAFETTGATAVGGKIVPYWAHRKPWWVSALLSGFLTAVDYGPSTLMSVDFRPVGANMAYVTQALRDAGGFSPEFGTRIIAGREVSLQAGEEAELVIRLLARGGSVAYCGGACVHHLVEGRRSTILGVRSHALRSGRAIAVLCGDEVDPVEVSQACIWERACAIACLLNLRLRDAIVFYARSTLKLGVMVEACRLRGGNYGVLRHLTRAVWKQRRGLLGLGRRVLLGRVFVPPGS